MKRPQPKVESEYKYKMTNGVLEELTAEEIAELEQRDREAMQKPAPEDKDNAGRQPN